MADGASAQRGRGCPAVLIAEWAGTGRKLLRPPRERPGGSDWVGTVDRVRRGPLWMYFKGQANRFL